MPVAPERPLRASLRPVRWVIALAAVGWVTTAGFNLIRAVRDASAGQRAGVAAAAMAGAEASGHGPAELDRVLAELRVAQARFVDASRLVDRPSVVPLRFLPVLGRQLRSFQALAVAGADVSAVSAEAVKRVDELLRPGDGGRADSVALLRELGTVAGGADSALAGVSFGPRAALLGALGSRRDILVTRVAELRTGLRRGEAGAAAAAALLEGPRRYLVLAANNAEMRAGSGMFLSAGLLRTEGGRLSMSVFGPTEDRFLPPGAVPLEGDLAARWDWLKPNQEWRNLGVSPRFDVTARLAAQMWVASGGEPVDGVMALDPVALRAILAAVGPVTVEGRVVSAENVVDEILHDQYVEYAADPLQFQRRERLGQIAQAVVQGLEGRDWRPDLLSRELAAAARARHVLAWSSRPEEEAGWVAAGIDGALHDTSLMVAVLNRGGNKLDRFLAVSADLRIDVGPRVAEGKLSLRLRNAVPFGEPAYVAGPEENSGVREGDYVGLVAVSLPQAARNVRIEGVDGVAVAGPDGPTQVVASAVRLGRSEELTVVVRFVLPGGPGSLRVEPSARVPGIDWTANGDELSDGGAHIVAW